MLDARPTRVIPVVSLSAVLLITSLAYAQPRLPPVPTTPNPPEATAPIDSEAEAARVRAALINEVPHLIVDQPARQREWIALTWAEVAASGLRIDRPQILVVVDRNLRVQQMRLILARSQGDWEDLGGARVSTGERGRRDYFLTPNGVFLHTAAILDWRAAGTFNTHHIRGLGESGMRVWDFGWQRAVKGWKTARKVSRIRLLLHATDPEHLAQRLGRAASKGCVRISEAMNLFLDRHGILDADYEQAAQQNPRFVALLLPDRTPTRLAGDVLIIVDSSEQS